MLPIACMGSNSGQSQRGGTPLPSEVSQKASPAIDGKLFGTLAWTLAVYLGGT